MPQQLPTRSAATRPARPDASMSLLTDVINHSLDDGYAEAAEREVRAGAQGLPRTVQAKLLLAFGLVLAGFVVTLGAAQAREAAPTLAKERERLIERIEDSTDDADALEGDVESLRATVGAAQRKALNKRGGDGEAELMALLAGTTRVTGPGLELVVDDAKDADNGDGSGPRRSSSFSDSGRLRDRDLQRIVNGLWESGAEAVAINGQRLTALSAIRAAGDAILVDNRPLPPPYTVLAIGDGHRLRSRFQDSVDGRYLHALEENYGIRASLSVRDRVTLPAAPGFTVRLASPASSPSPSGAPGTPDSSGTGSGSGTGKGTT